MARQQFVQICWGKLSPRLGFDRFLKNGSAANDVNVIGDGATGSLYLWCMVKPLKWSQTFFLKYLKFSLWSEGIEGFLLWSKGIAGFLLWSEGIEGFIKVEGVGCSCEQLSNIRWTRSEIWNRKVVGEERRGPCQVPQPTLGSKWVGEPD